MHSRALLACTLILGVSQVWSQVSPAGLTDVRDAEHSRQIVSVTWEQGQLSVSARQVPLHRVLTAIASKTGLMMEVSAGADSQLVCVEAGPASMRDVLRQILDADNTNYILLGSSTTPGYIERLILSSRGQHASATNQPAQLAAVQPPATRSDADDVDQELSAPEQVSAPVPASSTESRELAPSTAPPSVQQNINTQMSGYQNAFNEAAKGGKSRAEILDQLQKQQLKDLDAAAAQAQPQ